MAEVSIIAAERRERAGKGPARAARRAGRVPGVIYGAKKDPAMVTLDPRQLDRELNTGGFMATIYDVQIEQAKERVLPRDVQFDPVTDRPILVDFLRVSAATSVTVEVPVNFLNEEDIGARIHDAYGKNYQRLVDAKAKWDPDNFFRVNKNIAPQTDR